MQDHFLDEHQALTRRYFVGLGAAGVSALALLPKLARGEKPSEESAIESIVEKSDALAKAVKQLEYLTEQESFGDVSRGTPLPHSLSLEQRRKVGLTPETWQLQVLADPEHKADIQNPLTTDKGNAFNWKALMALAKKHAVAFPKIMTCNNIGAPLGMGIWEGVPLRHVLWLTKPKQNVRRVFYNGFHNNDPKQMFRSSLPVGRVLEEPPGLPPVILCYKLNGQLLHPERGGPVRMVVPEAYGFKSVKWLSHVYLSNLSHANDTYANGNNDLDSWLKTFAAVLEVGQPVKAQQPIPITGLSQVGISGLSKVQYWFHVKGNPLPVNDPYFDKAPWQDAEILGPPTQWGGKLPDNKIPEHTIGFNRKTGRPRHWPMRLAKAHWAALASGMPAGDYTLRCRSIDANGIAQPMPRPFRKSGRNAIQKTDVTVKA